MLAPPLILVVAIGREYNVLTSPEVRVYICQKGPQINVSSHIAGYNNQITIKPQNLY